MKITVQLADKKVVYEDIDSLFIPFSNNPILVHKDGSTTPLIHKNSMVSIKAED